jgi:hypothetical protein
MLLQEAEGRVGAAQTAALAAQEQAVQVCILIDPRAGAAVQRDRRAAAASAGSHLSAAHKNKSAP